MEMRHRKHVSLCESTDSDVERRLEATVESVCYARRKLPTVIFPCHSEKNTIGNGLGMNPIGRIERKWEEGAFQTSS